MILCVGPTGCGKSLLLKRLQTVNFQSSNYSDIPNTVPTVGTNIAIIKDKRNTLWIQEVGGSMAEIWDQYYSDSDAIIYVIDSTNLSKIGDSCISLFNLVSNPKVKNIKPILIALNKTDISCTSSIDEVKYFLMIEELISSVPNQSIEVIESSCVTGKGLDSIFNWMQSMNKINN
jgi:GTPase SAR1 family protein